MFKISKTTFSDNLQDLVDSVIRTFAELDQDNDFTQYEIVVNDKDLLQEMINKKFLSRRYLEKYISKKVDLKVEKDSNLLTLEIY